MQMQSSWSLCLAIGLFALNIQYPTFAATDAKRRQRRVFKMLTSSSSEKLVNETSTNQIESGNDRKDAETIIPTANDVLQRNSTVSLIGETNREPPLISGGKSKLTLKIMGQFKNTWCKTEPFMQLIKEPGCISRKVLNRFCYGQCNSFYIPRTLRKRTKKKFFKSCGFCQPKRTHTIIVTLKCPGRKKGFKQKKVKQIKQCRCMER
ncbi:Gremlin 2 [Mactra antiquata]